MTISNITREKRLLIFLVPLGLLWWVGLSSFGIGIAQAVIEGNDGALTVHQMATINAENCYDDEPSSDGTSTPHDESFWDCVDRNNRNSRSVLVKGDYEAVAEDGTPVLYEDIQDAIIADQKTWLTEDWKP